MPSHQPRRRWFQFGLRTLFVLVALASLGFGWLGYKMRQAQRQKEAVEAIEKLGAHVLYDYQRDAAGDPDFKATPPGPEWLRKFLGVDFFANVNRVHFVGNSITSGELVHLRKLSRLKYLGIFHTRVTDAGLMHVQQLSQLEGLRVSTEQVTDAGLIYLQGLKRLENLDLEGTQVTDEGCQELQKALPNLQIIR